MKKFILFFVLIIQLFSYEKVIYDGYISKSTFNSTYLVAGLENGDIVIKNFKTLKTLSIFSLPKIHDFMDELIAMPIYSLDISPNSKNLLILAQGENNIKIIYQYNFKNRKLSKIYSTKENLIQAKYITNENVLLGSLADESILFNLNSKKEIYKKQIGSYVFSTFALNSDRSLAAFGDESGKVTIINTINGKIVKRFEGFNKGKTLSLDFKGNLVFNGSEDRKISIYNIKSGYYLAKNSVKFLPYAGGISMNLKYYAVQFDEKNSIAIFSMDNKLIKLLKAHSMALNNLSFTKEKVVTISPAEIIIWNLKEIK